MAPTQAPQPGPRPYAPRVPVGEKIWPASSPSRWRDEARREIVRAITNL